MTKTKTRKIVILLCLIFFFVFIFEVIKAYGLFESNKDNVIKMDIATFSILVNDSSVFNEDFVVDSFVSDCTGYIKDGNIAPGCGGYFDIIINPQDTDVALKYDISLDLSTINNITLVSVSELNGKNIINSALDCYSGVISLDDINNNLQHHIRFNFNWENNEDNNEVDSAIGQDEAFQFSIPINVKVSQYLGEEIPPYVNN